MSPELTPSLPSQKISRLSKGGYEDEPISVLLVEDSATIRMQLRQSITQLDSVNLFEAESLMQAKAVLDTRAKELFCAILDLTLPDAHGLEIVDLVRAYDVPIIVLTGAADPALRQAVLDLRVIDYMLKTGAAAIEDVAYLIGRLRQNQSMKVMIVDDSSTYRMYLTGLLKQYCFQVLAATNGLEALVLLEQHPDTALIISDYFMPEMDGMEMTKNIRRHYRREDLAIIALSDMQKPELSAAMLKAGANDFVNKGFQSEEFFCRITQNANMVNYVRELRNLANLDYMTRTFNRRYLFGTGATLHAEAQAGRRQLAVAVVDADFFKKINDNYGHAAGDEALKRIANVLRHTFAPPDIAARYGGEEFVCVVNISRPEEVWARFEKLRADIEAIDLTCNDAKIPITASIGVTTRLGATLDEAIKFADMAVYRAKAEGRNRVVMG